MLNSFALNRSASGLPRISILQPLSPIVPAQHLCESAAAARAPEHTRIHHRLVPLPKHLRCCILAMLTSEHAYLPHPLGDSHGRVVNGIYRNLCAQAVVLLERMDPKKLRLEGQTEPGQAPTWPARLVLMVTFRLIVRAADEDGSLHHHASFITLCRAVAPTVQPGFRISNSSDFLQDHELRFLKDIDFAAYVSPELIEATERRIDRWLLASPEARRKDALKYPDACIIGPLLAEHLGHQSNVLQLAIDERARSHQVPSPKSPGMPTTPTSPTSPRWQATPELATLLERRQVKSLQQPGYFNHKPPAMPEDVMTHIRDLGWS